MGIKAGGGGMGGGMFVPQLLVAMNGTRKNESNCQHWVAIVLSVPGPLSDRKMQYSAVKNQVF